MKRPPHLAAILGAAAVAFSLLAAGCARTTASSSDGDTVNYIDAGSSCLCSYPRLEAEAQGYFADEGLTIKNKTSIFNANQLMQALAQGQADIALTGGSGPLASAAAGKTVKVVAVLGSPAPVQVTLNDAALKKLAAKGVTPASPYRTKMKALRGLKIASAATGSTTDLLFRQLLTSTGVPPSGVTIQPFNDAAAGTAAAKQGASDGMVGFPSQTTTPEADGWGKVFVDAQREAASVAAIPYIVVAVNPDFLKKHPDTVTRFLKAMVHARDDAKKLTPEQSKTLHEKFFASTSAKAWKVGIDAMLPVFDDDIVPTEKLADNMVTVYNVGRKDKVDVPFDQLYDTELAKKLAGS